MRSPGEAVARLARCRRTMKKPIGKQQRQAHPEQLRTLEREDSLVQADQDLVTHANQSQQLGQHRV